MINLDNLVTLHDNENTIRRHRRLLEELFYLCINPTFLETITSARLDVQNMLNGNDVILPIANNETAVELRNEHLARNGDYLRLLTGICERHNYYHPSFIRNYWQVAGDANTRNKFNILENIIFLNNPLPDPDQNPIEHFNNRSGYMEIDSDETGPYIRLQFDIGTTLKEIQDIIDKQFPDTAQFQKEQFNIPDTQYRRDKSLRIKAIIHEQTQMGENDTRIALLLEKEGLYGVENTGDSVRTQRNRMDVDSNRFTPND
jgi:DNA-binding transcriptional MerR regulator